MSQPIRNVTLVGASGNLGTLIHSKLAASGLFNITILQRIGSKSKYPAEVKVVEADFESVDSLTQVLKGQDALVVSVGHFGLEAQYKLLDAAINAGVNRFLPSEFGSDVDNPLTRKNPVQHDKVKVQDHLFARVKNTKLTYTLVYNGPFLDWGFQVNLTLDKSKWSPTIYNGGDIPYSTTTLATVGDAVVGVLTHLEETKNRAVYVEDLQITQNQLLRIAQKVAPNQPWSVKHANVNDMLPGARRHLGQGPPDFEKVIKPFLMQQFYSLGFGGAFEKTDNELLGIKPMTESQVEEIYRDIIGEGN